ncbi:MAG: phosphatase PAP2 family protein [Candidatus Promineifilaceae bacterium]
MQKPESIRPSVMPSSTVQQLLAYDEMLSARIVDFGADVLPRAAAWLLARSGDSLFWLAVSGILIWKELSLGWTLLITVIVTAALTGIAKGIFRRQRPVEKWAISTDKYAFPSGHASRTGAVAVALSFAFPSWTLVWLVWAILVALARVALSRHYLSDVIAGMIFGILISLLLQLVIF